jgi:pseudouridine synthase
MSTRAKIRLNRFIALAGVASRREADRIIDEGRVRVNKKIVQSQGSKVDPVKDTVEVDGRMIRPEEELVYILLNKPAGYLVTLKDPFRRPTASSLLPEMNVRIFPVGRLDADSEGVLLFTNDGEMANRLMHPRYRIRKVYRIQVKGKPDSQSVGKLEKGIYIDNKKTAPARVTLIRGSDKMSFLQVDIHEGRKREVRRMFQAVGHRVISLKRIKFADLSSGKLKPGST